ncbi:MAG: dihydroorotase, partial [Campylobacteraceae bacterium]|nr:dihydroorotase [Campylobacteraceae bacterium]
MKDILIKNVKVYDYQRKGDVKDIYILDGKIKKIGNKLDKKASKVINGKGLYLFPGLVDPHVHAVWAKGDGDAGLRMLLKAGVT